MVGEHDILVGSGGIWRNLVSDAERRLCIQKVDTNKLADVIKQFEMNDEHHCSDSNSAISRKIRHMVSLNINMRYYLT